jgi:hypothetical protein
MRGAPEGGQQVMGAPRVSPLAWLPSGKARQAIREPKRLGMLLRRDGAAHQTDKEWGESGKPAHGERALHRPAFLAAASTQSPKFL